MNELTIEDIRALKAEVARHKVQAHSLAAAQFVPTFNFGLRLAKADKDPKELRYWVEFMARMLGFVAEKDATNGSLSVVNITFGGGINAKPVETVDVEAKSVSDAVEIPCGPVQITMPARRAPPTAMETLPPLLVEDLPDIGAELLEG